MEDTIKRWVDYWKKYEPNKPYFECVLYGLVCLRDKYPWGDRRESISNAIWHALQADHRFREAK